MGFKRCASCKCAKPGADMCGTLRASSLGMNAATGHATVDRDTLISWLEAGSFEIYEETDDENMLDLSERGVELCEEHGLTVDVDAYGCAYCAQHTIS